MGAELERERKLEAPPSFSLASATVSGDEYALAPAHWHRLHTTYYDTPDLRLVRWGASLRYRAGEGWTLKLPQPARGTASYRTEHTFSEPAGTVPPAALDLASAMLRGARVAPVIELRTIRTSRSVASHGDEVAEIVEDDVRVIQASSVVDRFRQIEIELRKETPDMVLDELSASLRKAGAGRPNGEPKVAIAIGERAHDPEVAIPALGRDAIAAEVIRAALARSVERLVHTDSILRVAPDADAVHDARVSVRKLRSHLKTFVHVLDAPWANHLRGRLQWLGNLLSKARDADVLLESLAKRAESLPASDRRLVDEVYAPIRARRTRAYDAIARALRSERYVRLVDALIDAAKTPQLNELADQPARALLATLMTPVWRRLRKNVRRAGDAPRDRDLHRIRIKTKHVRYAAEALAPVAGPAAKRTALQAEALQMRLGKQHDAVNAAHALREHLGSPEQAFIGGALATLERAAAARYRRRWRTCWNRLASNKRARFWR
jgi:CHAD domain-containing protein